MKVYLTGMPMAAADYLALMRGRDVMYSYPSRRRAVWSDTSVFSSVVLDSGAYSVWKRGLSIDVDEYADYCHSVADGLAWYACLDVIGDWRAGLDNLARLERRGLSPVPVFHLGEPWGLLEDLVSGYERVAVGRGPGVSFRRTQLLLEEVFRRTADEDGAPLVRIHGFRMTHRRLMARFPFESVDSTTWISGSAYDELPTDTGRARGFSFLDDTDKARVWLAFFEGLEKAERFESDKAASSNRDTGPGEEAENVPR